ncbi:MAG: Ig-like domain-containing protein [Firmicutes bacterium]|nr:Ig-like domain-containing protein [Bacillota bacterium]
MSKQKMQVVAFILSFVMVLTVVHPVGVSVYGQHAEPGVFSFDIFNNGPGGSPSRPNAGLAASGIIRMWTQLNEANVPVYLAASDTVTALDQSGNCAMEFVSFNQVWQAGGWIPYFNRVDVNTNGIWWTINFAITVHGQTVEVLLVNPTPPEVIIRPVPGFSIFNNGPGGTQYPRPNASLAAAGTIRMWSQLDGENARFYFAAADTIKAIDQNGNCAMEFIRVSQVWQAGQGFLPYFNIIDVNKNAPWQHINFSVTVHGQTVEILLVNGNYTPPPGSHTVAFMVQPGAVGVYFAQGITTYVEVPDGGLIPADSIPDVVARTGFYFAGWDPIDPAEHGNVYDNLVFTAKFNALFHYVTFEATEGGELEPAAPFGLTVRIRDGFSFWPDRVPTPLADEGFIFAEWLPDDPGGYVIRRDMTFVAVFEPLDTPPDGPQFVLDPPVRRDYGMSPRNFIVADALARLGPNALYVTGIRIYADRIYGGMTGAIAPGPNGAGILTPSGNPRGGPVNAGMFYDGAFTFQLNEPAFTEINIVNNTAVFVMDIFWRYIYLSGYTFIDAYGFRVDPAETVPDGPVESVRIYEDDFSTVIGVATRLSAVVLPFTAANRDVTWASDNPDVAAVNANGVVTGIAEGTAVITVTTVDGGFTDTITVTVTDRIIVYDAYNDRFDFIPVLDLRDTPEQREFSFNVADLLPAKDVVRVSGIIFYVEPQGTGSWGGAISYGGPHVVLPGGGYGPNTDRFGTAGGTPMINGTLTFERGYTLFDQEDITNGTSTFYIDYWWGSGLNVSGFRFMFYDEAPAEGPRFRMLPPLTRTSNMRPRAFIVADAGARLGSNALDVAGVRIYVQDNLGCGLVGAIGPVTSGYSNTNPPNPLGMRFANADFVPVAFPADARAVTFAMAQLAFTQLNIDNGNAVFWMDIFNYGVTVLGYSFIDLNGNVVQPATDAAPTRVTGVNISPTNNCWNYHELQDIFATETQQLMAIVRPATATNRAVTWVSDNTAVATVNAAGLVTGVAPGTAVITVTTDDGGFTDSVTVTIIDRGITLVYPRFMLDEPMTRNVNDPPFVVANAGALLGENALQVAGIIVYATNIYGGFTGGLNAITAGGAPQFWRSDYVAVPGMPGTFRHVFQMSALAFNQGHINNNQAVFMMDVWWGHFTMIGFTFIDIDGDPVFPPGFQPPQPPPPTEYMWSLQNDLIDDLPLGTITSVNLAPYMRLNGLNPQTAEVRERAIGNRYVALVNRSGSGDGFHILNSITYSGSVSHPGALEFEVGDVVTVRGRIGEFDGPFHPWSGQIMLVGGHTGQGGSAVSMPIFDILNSPDASFEISLIITQSQLNSMLYNRWHNAQIFFRIDNPANHTMVPVYIDDIGIYRPS